MTTTMYMRLPLVPKISSTAVQPTTPADEWAGDLQELLSSHVTMTPPATSAARRGYDFSARPNLGPRSMSAGSGMSSLSARKAAALRMPPMVRQDSGIVDPAHNPTSPCDPQPHDTGLSTIVHTGHSALTHDTDLSTMVHTGHSSSAIPPAEQMRLPRPTSGLMPSHPGLPTFVLTPDEREHEPAMAADDDDSIVSFPRQYTATEERFVDSPVPASISSASIDPVRQIEARAALVQSPVPMASMSSISLDDPSSSSPETVQFSTPSLVGHVPASQTSLPDSGYAASSEGESIHTPEEQLSGSAALNSSRLGDTVPIGDLPCDIQALQNIGSDHLPSPHSPGADARPGFVLEDVIRLGPPPSNPSLSSSRRASYSSSRRDSEIGTAESNGDGDGMANFHPSTNPDSPRMGLGPRGQQQQYDDLRGEQFPPLSPQRNPNKRYSSAEYVYDRSESNGSGSSGSTQSTVTSPGDLSGSSSSGEGKRERRKSLGLTGLGLVQKIKEKIGGV
ncbi:hypothetical protein HMN09_01011000 [Mycena chlorophos]|uniref:Uncharacterized protein n=1 Tax=Mycena chlorophos TaxID=658473 RepID=A0A8H6VXY3_MYCCL|nr:hypothetical protein HMN09_01011000 [Mycena chlorophos]